MGEEVKIWSTPQHVFDKLNDEFKFDVDVCADSDNAKCAKWYGRDKGLNSAWLGNCFLNPPYGKEIGDWLAKALWMSSVGMATVVCLIPSRTNAPWWHDSVMKATEIRFVRKKLSFFGGKGVPFWGNAIVVFRSGQVGQMPKVTSWEQPR
jgi:phage N-6-adenine-methyltransferase